MISHTCYHDTRYTCIAGPKSTLSRRVAQNKKHVKRAMAEAGRAGGGADHRDFGAREPRRPATDTATDAAAAAPNHLHTALVRVICKRMRVSGPARALAACLRQHTQQPHEDRMWTVSVEAVGSGAVLIPALQLDLASTVGALRAKIASFKNGTDVRLFVGHGGPDLTEAAETRVSDSSLSDGATLVVVAIVCQSYLESYIEGACCTRCSLLCLACDPAACDDCGASVCRTCTDDLEKCHDCQCKPCPRCAGLQHCGSCDEWTCSDCGEVQECVHCTAGTCPSCGDQRDCDACGGVLCESWRAWPRESCCRYVRTNGISMRALPPVRL